MRKVLLLLVCIDFILILALGIGGVDWAGAYNVRSAFVGDTSKYTVRGVDVSEYQGNIDWNVLAGQDLDFAYIKATRGSGYQDKKFPFNWENARKSGLKVGAYHLFTFDEPPLKQAGNFIATVPDEEDDMPPAVDVELYGKDRDDPPETEKAVRNLAEFLDKLEAHYGKTPVIYATKKAYKLYIDGNFPDHPLWIRDPKAEPQLPGGRPWTIWQYNNDGELKGYGGESRFIDLNVFNGTEKEFDAFMRCQSKNAPAQNTESFYPKALYS